MLECRAFIRWCVMADGKIRRDPLFLGLTRPAMLLGVTYSWFTVETMIWLLTFIMTSQFGLVIPGFLATHFVGYMACSHEPRFIELIKIWADTATKCTNRGYHGNTSSYDLF